MQSGFKFHTAQSDDDFSLFQVLNIHAMKAYGYLPDDASQADIQKQNQEVKQYIDTKEKNVITLAQSANADSGAAGFIWAAERDGREPWYFEAQPAWIYNIWVEPDFRRQGLASMLIQSCLAWAKQQDFHKLGLHVFGYNHAAIKLYQKTGFQIDYAYLQKNLDETSAATMSEAKITITHGHDEKTLEVIKAGTFTCFSCQAEKFGGTDESEIKKRFDQWYANFDFALPKMHIFHVNQPNHGMSGFLWGYRSKGDLGDREYFWIQGFFASEQNADTTMVLENLLAELEKWLQKEGIDAIRTNVQFPPAVNVLKKNGFKPSNIFMSHKLI